MEMKNNSTITMMISYILLLYCGLTNASIDKTVPSMSNVKLSSYINENIQINGEQLDLSHRRQSRDNKQKSTTLDRFEFETRGIEARIGQGFQTRIPLSIFQVKEEEEDSDEWRLSLRTAENHRLFSNSWIFLDRHERELVGFPMQGNEGLFEFLVIANGPRGRSMKRPLAIRVVTDRDRASHHVKMTLGKGFRDFMGKSRVRILFATYLSEYLQKNGITTRMRDIWVYKTDSVSKSLSWILTTFNRNVCNHVVTELLPSRLLSKGKPHPELIDKFRPHFTFTNVSVEISEYCPKPIKNTKSNSPSTSQIVFGPLVVVVIIIVLGSPLLIAHIIRKNIRKRDRRRQFLQSRHLEVNGAPAPISTNQDDDDKNKTKDVINNSKSNRYRWKPDLTGRPVLVVPNTPPSRRATSRQASLAEEERLLMPLTDPLLGTKIPRVQNSILTWHGLPSDQCVEADTIQFPSVVTDLTTSISRPLKDVFEYFSGKPDQSSQSQPTGQQSDPLTTISGLVRSDLRSQSAMTRSEPCSRKSSAEINRRYMFGRQDTTKSEYTNGYVVRDRSRELYRNDMNAATYKWMGGHRNSLTRQESRETTASERSETSLLGSAFNKVSSLISLNNRQAPKVIRIFLSDESEDNTRNSSFDRPYALNESNSSPLISSQLSSFDRPSPSLVGSLRSSFDKPSPSLMSSQRSSFDKPSPSLMSCQLSSFEQNSPSLSSTQVNSIDYLSQSRSFSQDGSYEDQSSISDLGISFDHESLYDLSQPYHPTMDDMYLYDHRRQPLDDGYRPRQDKTMTTSPEHARNYYRRSVERLRSDGSSEGSFENPKRALIRQETVRVVNSPGDRKMVKQDSLGSSSKTCRDALPQNDSQLYSLRKNSLHPDDSRTIERRLKKQKSIYSPSGKQDVNYSPLHRIDTTNVHIQVPRYGQQTLSYPGIIEESCFMHTGAKTEIVYENGLNIIDRVTPSRV